MGRLNEAMIQHFSHPHSLYLSSIVPPLTICANCSLPANNTGLAYTCKSCNFNLHLNCVQIPPLIRHPSHPAHQLTLLPRSPSFSNCKACGRHVTGFSYHCPTCHVHLHTLCASMPMTITSGLHGHPLALAFSPPYENAMFSCDACGGPGGDHWLYRCVPCGFDTHVRCPGQQAGSPRSTDGRQQVVGVGTQGRLGRSGSGRGGGGLVRQMVQGLVGVASQQIGYKLLPGYTGGGRGGNGAGSPRVWNGNGNGSFGGGRNDQNVYGAAGATSNDQVGASGGDVGYGGWNEYESTSYSGDVRGEGSVTWTAHG